MGQEAKVAEASTHVIEGTSAGLPDRVVDDMRSLIVALIEEESKKLRLEIEDQGTTFHAALAELEVKIKSLEAEKDKVTDLEVMEYLKVAVQEAQRDANHALEELKRTRDDADERFG